MLASTARTVCHMTGEFPRKARRLYLQQEVGDAQEPAFLAHRLTLRSPETPVAPFEHGVTEVVAAVRLVDTHVVGYLDQRHGATQGARVGKRPGRIVAELVVLDLLENLFLVPLETERPLDDVVAADATRQTQALDLQLEAGDERHHPDQLDRFLANDHAVG